MRHSETKIGEEHAPFPYLSRSINHRRGGLTGLRPVLLSLSQQQRRTLPADEQPDQPILYGRSQR